MKDKRIRNVVKHLQQKFGPQNIVVKDNWEGDNCAIGITNYDGKYLVYVSSWQKMNDQYYVALESPTENKNEEFKASGIFENVDIEKMEEIIKVHFSL